MAVLTTAAFISKYTGVFANNSSRDISEADMREFAEDIKDSFQSILGATTITAWKDPCVVATTVNISLSGEQTIDGVLTSGSRVLVKNQSTTSQNGIYVSAAGAWARASDADVAAELEGAAVGISQGTTNKNSLWLQKTSGITLESSAIEWQQFGFSSIVNVLDEDDMASNSDTAVPTQQSVVNYVGSQLASGVISATVTIPSASVLTANSSPVQIIPAPGAGKILIPLYAVMSLDYNSVAYTTNTNGKLQIAGINVVANIGFAVSGDTVFIRPSIGNSATATATLENQPLVFTVDTGNPVAGDSDIKITVYYQVFNI